MSVTRTRRDGTAYRAACKHDPEFGPTCACGSRKSKQAFTCQSCHNVIRGYGTVPLREQWRKARERHLGIIRAVGDEDAGLIDRASTLAAARANAEGELAALVADQERDDRLGHLARDRWMVSLDSNDQYGRPLYETVAA